jgi:hypothetical protein
MNMSSPARDHHFVPQFYLRGWADNGGAQVMAYRTVVSRAEVPAWTPRSIKGVGFHRDLYAVLSSPELDEFERWIATEFEEPARETLDRVVNGDPLTPHDHERLGSFFAAQDVRTPASFFESQERWATQIPETFEHTLNKAVAKLEAARQAGTKLQSPAPGPNPFADAVRIKIEPHDEGRSAIRVRIASGRAFWIAQMRSLLTGRGIARLQSHKWSIVEPNGTAEWFTSDHPAMRLNFYNVENYDFGGGWGRENCDLFLPLSPRHLLYAQVGAEHAERFAFGPEHTRLIQRLLAERAHRWIFARQPIASVAQDRPRVVDADRFRAEERFWSNWDDANRKAEADD